jgi:lipoate-protein ligase A
MFNYIYLGYSTRSAEENLSLEEYYLLESEKTQNAYVRFYDFEKDTIVCGYAQAFDPIKKIDSSFSINRRTTGGSHIQVGKNSLAYSIIIPNNGQFKHMEDFRKYYSQKIADTLEELGIPDIEVDNNASTVMSDKKVIASHALRWNVKSGLLHGVVMITPYVMNILDQRVRLNERKIGNKFYSEFDALKNIPVLNDFINIDSSDKVKSLKFVFIKEFLNQLFRKTDISKYDILTKDLIGAKSIGKDRFYSNDWIKERLNPFKEEDVLAIPGSELCGKLEENKGYCLYVEVPDKKFKYMTEVKDF